MSKRKGLSHEEKRQKMIELFYEKRDFFQLKELERLAPKEKGIVSQSVKDIVQSLVDDALVDTDKIGTCVYFWAFPSKATTTQNNKIQSLQEKLRENTEKLNSLKKKTEEAQVGREEGDDRVSVLASLAGLEKQKEALLVEIQKYKDCDPELLKKLKEETEVALVAANRWTDNIFAVKSWCKNKFFIEEEKLNKQFEIPEDLDYI